MRYIFVAPETGSDARTPDEMVRALLPFTTGWDEVEKAAQRAIGSDREDFDQYIPVLVCDEWLVSR